MFENFIETMRKSFKYHKSKPGGVLGPYPKYVKPAATPSTKMILSRNELNAIDHLKDHYEFWSEWSGSRFVVTRNPYIDEKYYKKYYPSRYMTHKDYLRHVSLGATIQSNPVTGIWAPIA